MAPRHSRGARPTPPGLATFLAALRWTESGSPRGDYTEANGQGAYQILQSNWPSWAATYAGYQTTDPNASDAPQSVQDQVAVAKVTEYYYGPGEKNWRLVARIWNGGTPNVVPNPALGAGATTDTYADILLGHARDLAGSGQTFTVPTAAPGDTAAAAAGAASSQAPGSTICYHSFDARLFGSICMDKPIAVLATAGGGLLMLAGVAILLVGVARDTAPGRAATRALSATGAGADLARRAGAGAARHTPARRRARRTAAEQDALSAEVRRTEPVRAAARRQEAHDTRMIGRRLGPTGRTTPGPRTNRPPRRPLPEEAPF